MWRLRSIHSSHASNVAAIVDETKRRMALAYTERRYVAASSATSPRLVALVTDFACVLLEREGVILSLRDARTPDGHTLLTAAATVGAVRLTSALMGSDPLPRWPPR